MAVGLILRMHDVSWRSLTLDESYTVALAQRGLFEMVNLFRIEANGTLYPVVLTLPLRISEAVEVVRSPALIAGVIAIPATYWCGSLLANPRVGLVGAWLLALSPAAVRFAQEARGHSLAILLATLSFATLAKAVRSTRSLRWWTAYSLALTALAYSSTTAILTVPIAQLAIVARCGRAALRPWFGAIAAASCGSAPLVLLLVAEWGQRDALYWLSRPRLGEVAGLAGRFAVASAFSTDVGRVLAVGVVLLCASAIVGAHFARNVGTSHDRFPGATVALAAWAFAPTVILLLASQVRPLFTDRYVVSSLPGLALLVALALTRLPSAIAIATGTALAALFVGADVVKIHDTSDYRAAAAWIDARRTAPDPMLVVPVEQLPALAYYARYLRTADERLPVEEWRPAEVPHFVSGFRLPGGYGRAPVAPPKREHASALAARTGRVFVVSYPGTLGSAQDWFQLNCQVVGANLAFLAVAEFRDCGTRGREIQP